MNEKLKQIAIKAQVEHCISHVRLIEFAELIIAECADVARQCREDEWFDVEDAILEHFAIDRLRNINAGAEIHAGDGGYSIGTQEGYDKFVAERNASNPEFAEAMKQHFDRK